VLSDNYSFLIVDEQNKVALAVDPAGPQEMLDAASKEGAKLISVLTTHHHGDHAGGNSALVKAISGLKVYGGDERVEALTNKVSQGDHFEVGSLRVKVHFTPCHTSGHVLYEVSDKADVNGKIALFTGDTLFVAGCGRFFEGNAQQMYHALLEVIAKLPSDTLLYVGHEYTVKNLQFALTVDSNNPAVHDKLEWAKKQRSQGLSTLPSTVADELTYNPFMRVTNDAVADAIGLKGASPIEVMAELRRRKDHF